MPGAEPKLLLSWSFQFKGFPVYGSISTQAPTCISICTFFFFKLINLFIFGCVGSSFLWGPSPVAASGGHSSSRCAGLSLSWPLLLWSTSSGHGGSVVVAHGPSCSAACGIFRDQGLNPCALHWQADSQPLRYQGSPKMHFHRVYKIKIIKQLYHFYGKISSKFQTAKS